MSGVGVVYAAQCEEKVPRAYVAAGRVLQEHFSDVAKTRLCTDAAAAMVSASSDDGVSHRICSRSL